VVERVISYGHPNVTSNHPTTLEVTKDASISRRADCIIGVGADKGLADLREAFKKKAMAEGSRIKATLKAGPYTEVIYGEGHPDLTFAHPTDIVIRKSTFTCPRTLMIKSNISARDLDERIKTLLRDEKQVIILEVCIG
jgi:hypothetical protein|tara:strand:- start:66 stop:482 length:417 start_codon:yes stop_codon:yes gene_type:complete